MNDMVVFGTETGDSEKWRDGLRLFMDG